MVDHAEDGMEQMKLLRSIATDDSPEEIGALWRQMMVFKAFSEGDLTEARSRRAQAEAARENAERDAIEAAGRLSERLRRQADKKLSEADSLKAEAARILEQAQRELTRAAEAANQSEARAEQAMAVALAEARIKAQEIMEQARAAAAQEVTEIKREALTEIRAHLVRIDSIRAATDEELETQRIFTNIARLKASTSGVVAPVASDTKVERPERQQLPEPQEPDRVPKAEHDLSSAETKAGASTAVRQRADAPAESSAPSDAGTKAKPKKGVKA